MEINIKRVEDQKLDDGGVRTLFEVEPLERGFGITLGNTLRRICLSHLEGTAAISVRIDGATHEFSVLKGVMEDIVEIILNIKSIVFKTESNEIFTLSVDFDGPGDIKAKDLIVPAGIEIVNPEQHIATITESRKFSAELKVRKGKGYVLADEHNLEERAIDIIPLDSSFMPIKRFSYRVEQIRVGESSEPSTNKFEKLIMEIISNGSIEAEEAIGMAAKLLSQRLSPFLSLVGGDIITISSSSANVPQGQVKEPEPNYSNVGIESLNLSVRAYNCLKRANKNTLQDLIEMTTEELMSIKNFGKKSAEEVIQTLNEKGFFLSDDPRKVTPPVEQQNKSPYDMYIGSRMRG